MVGQLTEEGDADPALVQASMAADPSDIRRRRGSACLAARPTAAAKEEAWERAVDPGAPGTGRLERCYRRRTLRCIDGSDSPRLFRSARSALAE